MVKVAREDILPHFNDVFIAVGTAITDLDNTTRIAVESLDKLLKALQLA